MPTFTNNRNDAVHFTALSLTVQPGDSFEVSEESAEGFRVQEFPEVGESKSKKKSSTDEPADTSTNSQDGEN